jgi:hypothetical protein
MKDHYITNEGIPVYKILPLVFYKHDNITYDITGYIVGFLFPIIKKIFYEKPIMCRLIKFSNSDHETLQVECKNFMVLCKEFNKLRRYDLEKNIFKIIDRSKIFPLGVNIDFNAHQTVRNCKPKCRCGPNIDEKKYMRITKNKNTISEDNSDDYSLEYNSDDDSSEYDLLPEGAYDISRSFPEFDSDYSLEDDRIPEKDLDLSLTDRFPLFKYFLICNTIIYFVAISYF